MKKVITLCKKKKKKQYHKTKQRHNYFSKMFPVTPRNNVSIPDVGMSALPPRLQKFHARENRGKVRFRTPPPPEKNQPPGSPKKRLQNCAASSRARLRFSSFVFFPILLCLST